MKLARILLIAILSLALCLPTFALSETSQEQRLGTKMPDFTVTAIDGGTFTLSEALKDKDMVLINLWATWCGPCQAEFPYMEEAYQQYQDKVAIIALSVEPTDDVEKLTSFAAEYGMTFPVGSDSDTNLNDYFFVKGIPTSVVVDRFGNVCFVESGSMPSVTSFVRLFDTFVGEDYTESLVLNEMPPAKPTIAPVDAAELAPVLADESALIMLSNIEDEYTWPLLPVEKDGRTALASSNAGWDDSTAALDAHVTMPEDGALSFAFATSTEAAIDLLTVAVDGETVKSFGGEHPWTTWAIALTAGEHDITFAYSKDQAVAEGEDTVWLDDVALLTGDAAAQAFAALPVYPTGDALALTFTGANAREVVFSGEGADMMAELFGTTEYWIMGDVTAEFQVAVPANVDPEVAFVYTDFDGSIHALAAELLTADGAAYQGAVGIDSMETTGYSYTDIYIYPSAAAKDQIVGATVFANEENANAFVQMLADEDGMALTWAYADGTAVSTDTAAEGDAPLSEYTARFVDQNGAPVPGCVINFCTDDMCQLCVANDQGVVTFTGDPYPYHLQVIRVPEGYSFDKTQEYTADPNGGEMTFTITKN